MNHNPNDDSNYQFEIDAKLKETYKNAERIFGSNPETIKKIAKNSLIFGIIIMIISIKALLSLIVMFRINLWTFIFAAGAFMVYTSIYLRKNILKFPVLIVYNDEILFKKQKYFGKLKILSLYNLYSNTDFESLDRNDLKSVIMPTGIFNTADLCVETTLEESKVFLMINAEKEYLNHIAFYLAAYIKNKP
ncbi:hypothetical protein K6T82_12160 [Flavobacterium sp. 17A]|uniref:Uncharacterized protein n=1 Tax=Flavobacterium potami TaxID=2872310 RepID=A0A9X1HAG2_9FLAO|nr:hypothetical protein [Flavobacterium potami]MBZ4035525.1 hypothetical protein [Flavobacterium potami]